jgi:ribosomal protein L32
MCCGETIRDAGGATAWETKSLSKFGECGQMHRTSRTCSRCAFDAEESLNNAILQPGIAANFYIFLGDTWTPGPEQRLGH